MVLESSIFAFASNPRVCCIIDEQVNHADILKRYPEIAGCTFQVTESSHFVKDSGKSFIVLSASLGYYANCPIRSNYHICLRVLLGIVYAIALVFKKCFNSFPDHSEGGSRLKNIGNIVWNRSMPQKLEIWLQIPTEYSDGRKTDFLKYIDRQRIRLGMETPELLNKLAMSALRQAHLEIIRKELLSDSPMMSLV